MIEIQKHVNIAYSNHEIIISNNEASKINILSVKRYIYTECTLQYMYTLNEFQSVINIDSNKKIFRDHMCSRRGLQC